MDLQLIVGIIGGLGIGTLLNSLVTAFITSRTNRTNRIYEEKKHVYLGLLNSLHKAAVSLSLEASKEYALWQTQCSLFGNKKVMKFAQKIVDTNENLRERNVAFDRLIDAMREDLQHCL